MPDFSDCLFVSDFDRTLTDRQSRIPAENLEAIEYFQAHGGLFTMGTGRSIPMFRPHQTRVPCNAPVILCNGAVCYDYGAEVMSGPIWIPRGPEILRDLLRRYPRHSVEIEDVEYHYLFGENQARDEFYRQMDVPNRLLTPEQIPERFLKITIFHSFRGSGVAQFFGGTPEEDAEFTAVASQIAAAWPELSVDRSAVKILDIQAREATKGAASRALARRLGRRVLICAGDAMNDVTMLREADLAFAPADCEQGVRDLGCCRMTRPCGEGAVAGAVEALCGLF